MEWMLMPLKRYAEFSGRSRRQELWMFMLLLVLIWFVAFIAIMALGFSAAGLASGGGSGAVGGMMGMFASMGILAVIFGVIWLALFIPTLAVQVRRLHDTNRSGWWLFIYWGPVLLSWALTIGGAANQSGGLSAVGSILSLVGLIGMIVLIVFYCLPGTSGPNQYGPDPLGSGANLNETFA